jgi:hypothetical protein
MHLLNRNEPDADMNNISQRRTFLKKAVYAAPTLMVLGGMVKPTQAHAGFGSPPSDPNAFSSSQTSATESDSGTGDFSTDNDDVLQKTLDNGL